MIHRNLQNSANKSISINLRTHHLWIGDTTYGWVEAQQKRDANRVYQKMSCAEKESFRMKLAKIDEADANNEQSPPPTPTPV